MLQMWKAIPYFSLNAGYTLVEIEEEATPLAAGPADATIAFSIILVITGCMLVLGMAMIYFISCYKCRARILQLQNNEGKVSGWNLRRLRDTIIDIELQQTEQISSEL